jgi:hypothetical protein
MKTFRLFWLVFCCGFFVAACSNEKEDEPVVTGAMKILNLTASTDTIMAWDTATISVITNMPANSIKWEADHGTIMGSGDAITYYAGMCCIGTNTITCRVSGDDGSDTASIRIHITPWHP